MLFLKSALAVLAIMTFQAFANDCHILKHAPKEILELNKILNDPALFQEKMIVLKSVEKRLTDTIKHNDLGSACLKRHLPKLENFITMKGVLDRCDLGNQEAYDAEKKMRLCDRYLSAAASVSPSIIACTPALNQIPEIEKLLQAGGNISSEFLVAPFEKDLLNQSLLNSLNTYLTIQHKYQTTPLSLLQSVNDLCQNKCDDELKNKLMSHGQKILNDLKKSKTYSLNEIQNYLNKRIALLNNQLDNVISLNKTDGVVFIANKSKSNIESSKVEVFDNQSDPYLDISEDTNLDELQKEQEAKASEDKKAYLQKQANRTTKEKENDNLVESYDKAYQKYQHIYEQTVADERGGIFLFTDKLQKHTREFQSKNKNAGFLLNPWRGFYKHNYLSQKEGKELIKQSIKEAQDSILTQSHRMLELHQNAQEKKIDPEIALARIARTNPVALGTVLIQRPEYSIAACNALRTAAINETDDFWKKGFVYGGLVVGGFALGTMAATGGAFLLGAKAIAGVSLPTIAFGAAATGTAFGVFETPYWISEYAHQKKENQVLRQEAISASDNLALQDITHNNEQIDEAAFNSWLAGFGTIASGLETRYLLKSYKSATSLAQTLQLSDEATKGFLKQASRELLAFNSIANKIDELPNLKTLITKLHSFQSETQIKNLLSSLLQMSKDDLINALNILNKIGPEELDVLKKLKNIDIEDLLKNILSQKNTTISEYLETLQEITILNKEIANTADLDLKNVLIKNRDDLSKFIQNEVNVLKKKRELSFLNTAENLNLSDLELSRGHIGDTVLETLGNNPEFKKLESLAKRAAQKNGTRLSPELRAKALGTVMESHDELSNAAKKKMLLDAGFSNREIAYLRKEGLLHGKKTFKDIIKYFKNTESAKIRAKQDLIQSPEKFKAVLSNVDGVSLEVRARPFGVGMPTGDIYRVEKSLDGKLYFIVGDVSGHGTVSAQECLKIHEMFEKMPLLKDAVAQGLPPGDLIKIIETNYTDSMGKYFTMAIAQVDPKTGEIIHSGAGHPPFFIKRADGAVESLSNAGSAIFEEMVRPYEPQNRFASQAKKLNNGDMLIGITDGVYENRLVPRNKETLLTKNINADAENVLAPILKKESSHKNIANKVSAASTPDDATTIVVKFDGITKKVSDANKLYPENIYAVKQYQKILQEDFPTLDAVITMKAAKKGELSSDVVHIDKLVDGKLLVIVGDVTGHGNQSAGIANKFRDFLSTDETFTGLYKFKENTTVEDLAKAIRTNFKVDAKNRYIQTSVTIIDPKTGAINNCSLGESFVEIVEKNGAIVDLKSSPFGHVNDKDPVSFYSKAKAKTDTLLKDELLIIRTDGKSTQGIKKLNTTNAQETAEILNKLPDPVESDPDDFTTVVIRLK